MARWKISHIVGDEISIWRVRQLASHINLLPEELFAQNIIPERPIDAQFIEANLLRRIYCTGKRFASELASARNLHNYLKTEKPDILVCWDTQSAEQLKLALLGIRTTMTIILMMFRPAITREEQTKLKLAYNVLGAHIFCNTKLTYESICNIVSSTERIHRVYPAAGSITRADKTALRKYFGFDKSNFLIYVSPDSKQEDLLKTLNGIGIVQQVYPDIRAVIAAKNEELATRLQIFNRNCLIDDILLMRDYKESQALLSCCDMCIIPRGIFSEHIDTLEAMQLQIPVLISEYDIIDDVIIHDKTFLSVKRFIPRTIASAIYKLINDSQLRAELTNNAHEIVNKHCSKLAYRSLIIRTYQQIMKQ